MRYYSVCSCCREVFFFSLVQRYEEDFNATTDKFYRQIDAFY